MSLSSREIGKALGVSHVAVNKAALRGRIPREEDGGFDLAKVQAVWVVNADQHQRARGLKALTPKIVPAPAAKPKRHEKRKEPESPGTLHETPDVVETMADAQRRKEVAVANLKELELRKAEGELIETTEVERHWSSIVSAARNRLLLVAAKLAPKVSVLSDVRECQAAIEREIKEALAALVEEDEAQAA